VVLVGAIGFVGERSRGLTNVSASGVPRTSLHLQFAKGELENYKGLAVKGDKK
jgi:hypothetical protein